MFSLKKEICEVIDVLTRIRSEHLQKNKCMYKLKCGGCHLFKVHRQDYIPQGFRLQNHHSHPTHHTGSFFTYLNSHNPLQVYVIVPIIQLFKHVQRSKLHS